MRSIYGESGKLKRWGPLLEGPEKFSHPKSCSKISNLMTLFYSHILNMNRGSLHTRIFRRIHLSVFKYQLTKNGFVGPKSFRGFRETGPWLLSFLSCNFMTNGLQKGSEMCKGITQLAVVVG